MEKTIYITMGHFDYEGSTVICGFKSFESAEESIDKSCYKKHDTDNDWYIRIKNSDACFDDISIERLEIKD